MGETHTASRGTRGVSYRVVRGMLTIMFFWLFWKFGGLVLNVIVARLFGSGVEADAYFFACQAVVYTLIFATGLKVVIPAFIPLFIEVRTQQGEQQAWAFVNTVLNLLIVAAVALVVIVSVWAAPITDTLVRGFSPEARALGVRLLRLVMPGAAVLMASWLLTGLLNSQKCFSIPPAADAVQKLLWAAALFVTYRFLHLGVYAVALGFLAGCCGQLLVFLFGLRQWRRQYRPSLPLVGGRRLATEAGWLAAALVVTGAAVLVMDRFLQGKGRDIGVFTAVTAGTAGYTLLLWQRAKGRATVLARFAALAAPLLMSALFARYRDFITYYFQSFTFEGVYADIEYAKKIAMLLPVGVSYALSIAMFPYLCELAAKKASGDLSDILGRTLRMLAVAFVPLTALIAVLAEPIVRLAYDQGGLAPIHVMYMAVSLRILATALVFYGIENVVMQGFFSIQSMWWPTLMGIVATFVHFAILAVPIYGFGLDAPGQIFLAVAAAYPLSRIFKNLVLMGVLNRRVRLFPARATLAFLARLALVTLVTTAVTWGAGKAVKSALPLAPYMMRESVVDIFDPEPATWLAPNARQLALAPAGGHRRSLKVAYPRGRMADTAMVRDLSCLKPMTVAAVRIRCVSKADAELILSMSEKAGSTSAPVARTRLAAGKPADEVLKLEPRPAEAPTGLIIRDLTALGAGPYERENELEIEDVTLLDPDGKALWTEDFSGLGWTLDGGPSEGLQPMPDEKGPTALVIPPAAATAVRSLSAINAGGCDHLRLKLFVPIPPEAPVGVAVEAADGKRYAGQYRPDRAGWNRVRLKLSDLRAADGSRADGAAGSLVRLALELPPGRTGLWGVREVVFYRPATVRYEAVKFIHCAVPGGLGVLACLLAVWLLRMEELAAVVQWVKRRAWRERGIRAAEDETGDAGDGTRQKYGLDG